MFDETDTDSLEISPHDVWQLISDGTSELVLVDVREDYELTRGMLPGAIHRPLSRFGQYQQDWRTDVRYIIYCEHGVRSLDVALWLLQEKHIKSESMQGGFAEWAGPVHPVKAGERA